MGKLLELQSFFINGASGAGVYAPLAAVAGDSLNVKNGKEGAKIRCIALWVQNELTLGFSQVLSPNLHDSTRGYRFNTNVNDERNVLPRGVTLPFNPQDTLTIQETGSVAGEGVLVHMLNFYDDFGSIDANLIAVDELFTRAKMPTSLSNTITPLNEQVYSAPQIITAGSDLLHANTEYALLGAEVDVSNGALVITAPDWANVRIGIPANWLAKEEGKDFFVNLSRDLGIACIPVFNSGNKGNIIIQAITAMAALTATNFHLNLMELTSK